LKEEPFPKRGGGNGSENGTNICMRCAGGTGAYNAFNEETGCNHTCFGEV
jgi:hypothetical protein